MPPHQHRGHQAVEWRERPPPAWQETFDGPAVGGVEKMKRGQGYSGHRDADDHREHLRPCRRRAVAGVQGRRELQAGRRWAGQVGEDADDLRAEVVSALLATERLAGCVAVGTLDQANELGGDPVGLPGEGEALTGRAQHLIQRGADHRHVAVDQHQVVVDALDQQAAIDRLGRLLGHRRQEHSLVAVRPSRTTGDIRPESGESGGGLARDGDRQVSRDVADQRGIDALQYPVLGPVQLGGGLLHRQEGRRDRECRSDQSGDDRDQARSPVVRPGGNHGA